MPRSMEKTNEYSGLLLALMFALEVEQTILQLFDQRPGPRMAARLEPTLP